MLIAGFGAIGKTTISKKYDNISDLESSDYKYIVDDKLKDIPKERQKGLTTRKLNPKFPQNYYNAIIRELENGKIVLISAQNEIMDLIRKKNIEYIIVYPKENMLKEIINRCKDRGNNDNFISGVRDAYYKFYPKNSDKVIWINEGEYLEDALKKEKII